MSLGRIGLDRYEEVATLFCDSSGLGRETELALTKDQALAEAKKILKTFREQELFVGLSGIGKFQVYVTVYKAVRS